MKSLIFLSALGLARAYWLMGIEDFITTERIDPIVNPGKVSGHAHSVLGGSNFGFQTNTAKLRQSECTSIPIPQDKSNYWFPHLYFQWRNGSFSSMNGGAVIYYLFGDKAGTTTAFPDDFRMLSGDPGLRTYDPNSFAQQAVTFLCLDFNGVTTRHNSLPLKSCPSGVRAQINFPSCWDGKNLDSPDHKSHVAFMSEGPDKGSCKDPNYPVTLPRIFIEVYWSTSEWEPVRSQAMNTTQPFVYSYGDRTGYGYHADFLNGWDKGVLQKAVDNCHCNIYGDPKCCVDQGIFDMTQGKTCRITKSVDEQTTGTIPKLPGNNPVQPEGTRATMFSDPVTPAILAPVYAYTGDSPPAYGSVVTNAKTASSGSSTTPPTSSTSSSSVDGEKTSATVSSSTVLSTSSSSLSAVSSSPVPSTSSSSLPAVSSSSIPSTISSSSDAQITSSAHSSASASPTTTHSATSASSTPSSSDSDDEDLEDCDDNDSTNSGSDAVTQPPGGESSSNAPPAEDSGYGTVTHPTGDSSPSHPSSNPPPASAGSYASNSSSTDSHPAAPTQGFATAPSKDEPKPGSCDIGAFHKQYLSHKHRSLRRARRSHRFHH